MDGVSIAFESANAEERVVVDSAATNEESATNATETSPSMLKLLMDMLSTRSKRRSKREGMAVKFEAEEKQTHIDMLAVLIAQSKEAQKSQGQRQQQGQEEQQGVQRKAIPTSNCIMRMSCSATS